MEGLAVVFALFAVAGGGIIVLDAFILSRLRRAARSRGDHDPWDER